jgi:hypothetical protein
MITVKRLKIVMITQIIKRMKHEIRTGGKIFKKISEEFAPCLKGVQVGGILINGS